MIPKVIHYCWFGKKPLPESALRCISSWKKHCPEYVIKRWDESNFSIKKAPTYVKQAYKMKKWAFVTDYVRLWIVYNYGGVYLDTDVELIKPLDSLLIYDAFFGFQDLLGNNKKIYIATGLGFGSVEKHLLVNKLMRSYDKLVFIKKDGAIDMTSCPILNASIFEEWGFVLNGNTQYINNVRVLSCDYLCPMNYPEKRLLITENTISIHHFDASWHKYGRKRQLTLGYLFSSLKHKSVNLTKIGFKKIFGAKAYNKLKNFIKR